MSARLEAIVDEERRGCKGCRGGLRPASADIDRMLEAAMFHSPDVCVPDSVYRSRIAACAGCPKLQDGETCLVCGCYVRISAKLKAKACPLPGDRRWDKYAN
jgi:hypothetical protein